MKRYRAGQVSQRGQLACPSAGRNCFSHTFHRVSGSLPLFHRFFPFNPSIGSTSHGSLRFLHYSVLRAADNAIIRLPLQTETPLNYGNVRTFSVIKPGAYGNAKISARLICPRDALIVRFADFQRLSSLVVQRYD